MTAMDAATVELLQGSLHELLTGLGSGAGLGAALDELGWGEVQASDPAQAGTLLFTELGHALVSSAALDKVVLAALDDALPTTGGARAVLHPLGSSTPASTPVTIRGVVLQPLTAVEQLVVPVAGEGGTALAVMGTDTLTAVPVDGFGHGSGWSRVDAAPVDLQTFPLSAETWTRAVAAAHRAIAAELVGACTAGLALAVEHTTNRHQYGRAIGSFQAVRHRLSETHVIIESARRSIELAWAVSDEPDGGSWEARLAKIRAGRAQADTMRNLIQVFGGMGLSMESPVHPYVTRAAALDLLFGGHARLSEELGADLLGGSPARAVVEI